MKHYDQRYILGTIWLILATYSAGATTPTCPMGATLPGVGIAVSILATNTVDGQTNRPVGGSTVGVCTPLWVFATLIYEAQDAQGHTGAGGSDGQVYISTRPPNSQFLVDDTPPGGIPLIGPFLTTDPGCAGDTNFFGTPTIRY